MASEFEIVLSRRVVPQPSPAIVSGGDCGACVLAGVFGLTVAEAYELQGRTDSIHFSEMSRILSACDGNGLADGAIDEPAFWLPFYGTSGKYSFGIQARDCVRGWVNYLRMALTAGYYAIAHVDFNRNLTNKRGRETNHWVLLVGLRARWVPHATVAGTKTLVEEVLVSCSARSSPGEEWVDAHDFLRERGGLDLLLVRPGVR